MTGPSPFRPRSVLPPMPAFPEFYRAINDRQPFPWQARLASRVRADGQWPGEVGVPTGLGKTACLEIALWWLASEADFEPAERRAPTRIWWVVSRRLLVDATAAHAESLARRLKNPDEIKDQGSASIVAGVADRLQSLSAGSTAAPLEVIRLRGRRGTANANRSVPPDSPVVHAADVRFEASVSRLRFEPAVRRCRHGGNRQPCPVG